MKVIIIEDEAAAYANIKNILGKVAPEAEVITHFDTVVDSVNWFRNHPLPDLVFMDIELADGSSFHIFECVTLNVPVIFTTAFDHYAIKAFEVNSIDYLLKPITHEAMTRAMDKYRQLHPALLSDPFEWETTCIKRLLVPYRDRIIPIKTEQIAYLYSTNGKTSVTTLDDKTYALGKSLDVLMQRLDKQQFFRANRQFILSRESIESFSIWGDSRLHVHLKQNSEEPVFIAKNRASEFKEWLMMF